VTLRRLLAVSHQATITGAPICLLHLLGWIRANTDVEVHTLVLRDGPLRPRFEAHGEVTVLDRSSPAKLLAALQHGLANGGSRRAWRPVAAVRLTPQLRHLRDFDLAYFNSASSIEVLDHLPTPRAVVSHVHEQQVALRTWLPLHDYELFKTRPDRWIAASGAVRELLVDELELPAERVLLHHEFIDAVGIASRVVTPREVASRRRAIGLPADAAVIIGAGTLEWRKGPDLFVQMAAEVRRRTRRPVQFVWLGGDAHGTEWERVRSDRDRAGAHHVHFIGMQDDPLPWFAMADVFALTSREDPFPLVCLEAAAIGLPIVTYRNGGIVELLDDSGREAARGVVDHLDVGAFADRVLDLLHDEQLRTTVAAQLRARVLAEHDVQVAAPKLFADLQALSAGRP
jgi:glycosyltransferase involved in cell wall biosynthesis